MINKVTTALLAVFVLMQVPSAIQSQNLNRCVKQMRTDELTQAGWREEQAHSSAVSYCNGRGR